MACGCGDSAGRAGSGGKQALVSPVPEATQVHKQARRQVSELAHELPPLRPGSMKVAAATALAPVRHESAAEPLRITCNEEEWPQTAVNGARISAEAIAQEMQYHPAANRGEAVFQAVRALVIRELLLQRSRELGLPVQANPGESTEEAAIRQLIEREVRVPEADASACEHFYTSNLPHYVSAPLLAARHILLDCAPDDAEGRSLAQEKAEGLLAELKQYPERFAELALAHSACPSKAQGGALGQLSKGQTVPEFEQQLFRQPQGLVGQPLESRYGFHVVWVDQRIDGVQLPYTAVADNIRRELYQRIWQKAVAQYLQSLVAAADIQGIQL